MTYDGLPNLFGAATRANYGPIPVVRQENQFFGLNGTQSLHGGTRGVQITVQGVLVGSSPGEVVDAESTLNSYVDGVGRTFVDNFGRTYHNVIVTSFAVPHDAGIRPCTMGFGLPYSITLQWLG